MTPAERIAAALQVALKDADGGPIYNSATIALDALCPKGESIRLDRTGDTDRLVRQRPFTKYQQRHERSMIEVMQPNEVWMNGTWLWVDIEDGTEGAPA